VISTNNEQPKAATPDDPRVIRAVEEYVAALEAGARPDRQAFLARHADLANALAGCLDGLDFIRAARPQLDDATAAPEETVSAPLGDFRILREVGRGGMGIVYEAEQMSLGRRVALKVLPFAATMDPRHLQRFKNEAHAAAQLHHTNIVPVYYVGCERSVHFYAMQFIEGHSLADMISQLRQMEEHQEASRKAAKDAKVDPNATVPFAPSRLCVSPCLPSESANPPTPPVAALSTIRSAKDAGYFRTVAELGIQAAEALDFAHQHGVVHRDIKPANLLVDAESRLWVTDFGLAQVQGDARMTMTGDLVGTLRYMSPEQALAKRVAVDHRTDVYSLGATLYELLTQEPAFTGTDRQELLRQIAFEEPRPLRRRNKAIPGELETIVLKALEKNPADRYGTAQELAEDLERFVKDKPIRARPPSFVNRFRKLIRRHKPLTAAAAGLLAATFAVAGVLAWVALDRAARRALVASRTDDALWALDRLRGQGRWEEALEAVRHVAALVDGGPADKELRDKVRALVRDLELVHALEDARLQGSAMEQGHFEHGLADHLYTVAFEQAGLDMEALPAEESAERIRQSTVAAEVAAALDLWALVRLELRRESDGSWQHFLRIARAADPDPWRDRVRAALERRDVESLEELARSEHVFHQSALTLTTLGTVLAKNRALEPAEALLRRSQQIHPGDFWANYGLGLALAETRRPLLDEAIRFGTAAVALRPNCAGAHINLGNALRDKGRLDEAIIHYREANRLDEHSHLAHNNLGAALQDKGQLDKAIEEYREAIRLSADYFAPHTNLGNALRLKGLLDEAIAEHREALRLKKDSAETHHNLGMALEEKGLLDEAIAAYRQALRIDKRLPGPYNNLGLALQRQGRLDEAIALNREAIRLRPDSAEAHGNLGNALHVKGQLDETIAEYQKAIELGPHFAQGPYGLGNAFRDKGLLDEAIASYQKAIRLRPEFAEAHCNLGLVLRRKGLLLESLAALRSGHELGSKQPRWHYPSAQWLCQAERLVELDAKLPKLLKGELQPADLGEHLALAQMCQEYKGLYLAAFRFYSDAFAEQPALADDLQLQHRYNAACAAALAGCGQGKDADQTDDMERARLRRQALDWLRADLAVYRKVLDKEPDKAGPEIVKRMRHWQQDKDFAGVRGDSLSKLPEAERHNWQRLWEEVEALR
jgi:serine/threonine protein kinase/Flp pilus assembly protein TadD